MDWIQVLCIFHLVRVWSGIGLHSLLCYNLAPRVYAEGLLSTTCVVVSDLREEGDQQLSCTEKTILLLNDENIAVSRRKYSSLVRSILMGI